MFGNSISFVLKPKSSNFLILSFKFFETDSSSPSFKKCHGTPTVISFFVFFILFSVFIVVESSSSSPAIRLKSNSLSPTVLVIGPA